MRTQKFEAKDKILVLFWFLSVIRALSGLWLHEGKQSAKEGERKGSNPISQPIGIVYLSHYYAVVKQFRHGPQLLNSNSVFVSRVANRIVNYDCQMEEEVFAKILANY